jgi:hypothetical protein
MRARAIVGALAILAAGASARADDEPHRFGLSYDVQLTGIPVMSLDVQALLAPDRYAVRTYLFTFGVLDWLFRFRNEFASDGVIAGERVKPARYTALGMWRGSTRAVDMTYGDGGALDIAIRPDARDDDRDPVPEAMRLGTLDPLSALVLTNLGRAAAGGGAGGPCPGMAPIFDGRRRYNVKLELVGPDVLEAGSGGIAVGPAIKCLLSVEPIAGYQKSRPQQKRPPSELWFQRLHDDRIWVPVRIQGDSFFGGFSAVLRAFTARHDI